MKDDLSGVNGEFESAASGMNRPRVIKIDFGNYMEMFDDPNIPDEKKRQMIEALCMIVLPIVDLAFGIHPVQQACGQPQLSLDSAAGKDSDDGNLMENTPNNEW